MGNGQHSSRHALRPQGHSAPSAQAKEQLAASGLGTHARRCPRRLECLEKKGISLTCASITPSGKDPDFQPDSRSNQQSISGKLPTESTRLPALLRAPRLVAESLTAL